MRKKGSTIFQAFLRTARLAAVALAAASFQQANANEQTLKSFGGAVFREGQHPQAALVQGVDGALYGTTTTGGINNAGTLFKLNLDGTGYRMLHEFGGFAADGRQPSSALVQDSDSTLYGVTRAGGTNSYGTVFKLKSDGSGYEVLYAFVPRKLPGFLPLNFPTLMLGSDGSLYGTTSGGGTNDLGTVFKLNRDGSGLEVIHTLPPQQGLQYQGALIEGLDGMLYGSTALGGPKAVGNVFKLNRDGTSYSVIYTFGAVTNDATQPEAALVQDVDGTLYGTTATGGTYGFGTIFQIHPDGSDYKVALSFQGPGTYGPVVQAGLLRVADGWLYGVAPGGGIAPGQVFRFSPTTRAFEVLHDFSFNQALSDGSHPQAELVLATNGMLYGTTYDGGRSSLGCVYQTQTDGSGFAVIHSFGITYGDGSMPICALAQSSDGALFGTTSVGGTNGMGIVFKLGPDGTGYEVLHGFTGGSQDGNNPGPGVVLGRNNTLYGVTGSGGISDAGTIFRVDQDGSNFRLLHHFGTVIEDGTAPTASLFYGNGGVLYGTTFGGGSSNAGTIFQIDPSGTGYRILHSFTGGPNDGAYPEQALVQGTDGVLFGTTSKGGISGAGTVFKIAPDGTAFSLLHSFNFLTNEGYPPGGLVIGNNGDLYGVISSSGAIPFAGAIFRIKTDGSGFAQIFNFSTNRINGNWLQAPLVQSSDGTLYGTAPANQTNKQGIAFRLNPDGTGFAAIHQFGSVLNGGGRPYNALLLGMDGALYGTTEVGGSYGSGTVFRLNTVPAPPSFLISISAPSAAGFQLSTEGMLASTYVLETSTDLTNWFSIGSVSNQTGTVDFLDWSGSKDPKRFYRMLVPP